MTGRSWIVLPLLALLAACAGGLGNGISARTGSGAVEMSPAAYRAYQAYRATPEPLAFALSPDGSQFYGFQCISLKNDCDAEASMLDAVARCSVRGGGQTCYIFARRRAVVWRNAGSFAPS